MSKTPELRQRWGRSALRALRIAASTIALIELLRSDWAGGVAASLAWLMFVQVERRWQPKSSDLDQIQSQVGGPSS